MDTHFFVGLLLGVPLGSTLLGVFLSLLPRSEPLEVTGTIFTEVSLPPDYIVGEQIP